MFADPLSAVLAYAALQAGHHAGDYWLQSDHQATTKGACSHAGRWACTGHVATLTAAQAVALAAVTAATGTELDPAAAVLGLGVNAASHYWADRRRTLRGLVLATEPLVRKRAFYDGSGSGPMDQAWHAVWLLPAALIAAAPLTEALAITGACVLMLLICHLVSHLGHLEEQRNRDCSGSAANEGANQ